jgi:hypothetical protein
MTPSRDGSPVLLDADEKSSLRMLNKGKSKAEDVLGDEDALPGLVGKDREAFALLVALCKFQRRM